VASPITPCLWFDGKAEEAVEFYRSVFPETEIVTTLRYTEAGPGPVGGVLAITFRLRGEEFLALNGGPHFSFTPAISVLVRCRDQAELDLYWEKLLAGGEAMQCGWLRDRFGVTWQIVPEKLLAMHQDADRARAARVMRAMMGMVKLDIAGLEAAYRDAA
jgi:predicted 3-demethylubiquinone-9 3-methyltransferase (glyoxalase superfamily)